MSFGKAIMAYSHSRKIVSALLIVLSFLAASCGGGGNGGDENLVLGSDQTLSGQAVLVCSQGCLDRAQCGLSDQVETVLLNSTGAATRNHDIAIPAGTVVNVDHQEMHPVVQVSDQASGRVPFYLVEMPEVGFGWVAGWCVGQEVQ
jgi:hypothetical protein